MLSVTPGSYEIYAITGYSKLSNIKKHHVYFKISHFLKTLLRTLNPFRIEWIDDNSCNLIWQEQDDCIKSLLRISKDPEVSEPEEENEKKKKTKKDKHGKIVKIPKRKTNNQFQNILRECHFPLHKNGRNFHLDVRLALLSDKKIRGAQKRSRYYQKSGNPNYNNMTGVLTSEMRMQMDNEIVQNERQELGLSTSAFMETRDSETFQSKQEDVKKEHKPTVYDDFDMIGDAEDVLLRAKGMFDCLIFEI